MMTEQDNARIERIRTLHQKMDAITKEIAKLDDKMADCWSALESERLDAPWRGIGE